MIATHDTTYKGDEVSWQQLRLAASVKASVEQLDLMIANFIDTAASIPPSPHTETDVKSHVVAVFRALEEEQLVPATLVPGSWSRFADNLWALARRWKRGPATEPALRELLEGFADSVRRQEFEPALSGTLFQAVVAFASNHEPGLIEKTPMVPSSELPDLYGVSMPPRLISGPSSTGHDDDQESTPQE